MRNWSAIDISSDGSKVVACANGGYIYTSTDGGITWNERITAGFRAWTGVAFYSAGIIACEYGGGIWTSTDNGVTWSQDLSATVSAARNWNSLAVSPDLTRIILTAYNTTSNIVTWYSGTWTERTGNTRYTYKAAISNTGYIS